jgi:mono/diheme cytochrome c family protein
VPLVIGLILLYALWTLRAPSPSPGITNTAVAGATGALSPERIPLVTGDEPLADIFTKAGCVVCHRIPGIPGANGQVGPPLLLGSTGAQRIQDPAYQGQAKTVHEYVVESVVEPRRFVVQGYPGETMPTWYGSKLSALALEKIAAYLEQQTGTP